MKRDWNVIRSILKAIEQLPDENSQIESSMIPEVDPVSAAYNMRLLRDAGLIKGGCRESIGMPYCFATSMTWEGHELLDTIRTDKAWSRIKSVALEKSIDLSLSSILQIASSITGSLL